VLVPAFDLLGSGVEGWNHQRIVDNAVLDERVTLGRGVNVEVSVLSLLVHSDALVCHLLEESLTALVQGLDREVLLAVRQSEHKLFFGSPVVFKLASQVFDHLGSFGGCFGAKRHGNVSLSVD